MESRGFPRIHSIFYAVFDIIKGTVVKHQVPEGSITPRLVGAMEDSALVAKPLIDFDAISEFVIPKKELYRRLVTICTNNYKVMGCPVVLHDHEKYQHFRNEFRFNLCFVFEQEAETSSYEAVVRKLSRVLEGLELECCFLSDDASAETQRVQGVIEQLFEDLNSYCECQIPINTFNSINLKLFPTYPNPRAVYEYEVPVCIVDLGKIVTPNWDVTVQRVLDYINGINHIQRIAELANVKLDWAKQCIRHLMYYGCVIMTDIFQFTNVYAVKHEITRLLDASSGLGSECLRYITLPDAPMPPLARVFALYCGLQYGTTVRDWVDEHQVRSMPIDVRRFISFGVIKGLIYRVHKYPVLVSTSPGETVFSVVPRTPHQNQTIVHSITGSLIPSDVVPFLDGRHHYDEICTKIKCSPHELDEQLGYSTVLMSNLAGGMVPKPNQTAFVTDMLEQPLQRGSVQLSAPTPRAEEISTEPNQQQPKWHVRFIFR